MNVLPTRLPGVLLFAPDVYSDDRGYLFEVWNHRKYADLGLPVPFVQDNLSRSKKGVLRGLHFQWPTAQGKLVTALHGEIWDVAVDIREGSPTYGHWEGYTLNDKNQNQVYIPEGFAHGFVVLSNTATVLYKCTNFYTPKDEGSVSWADPDIGIDWPVKEPILAPKDREAPSLRDIAPERRPRFDTDAR